MAAKKKAAEKTIERTYTIPLRKEYMKAPRYKRTPRAVKAVRDFLQRHMKSEIVLLGKHLNDELWKHGIRRPPHHLKVTVQKDEKNVVKAELFGVTLEEKATAPVKTKKVPAPAEEAVASAPEVAPVPE